jgi:hypothetical protein
MVPIFIRSRIRDGVPAGNGWFFAPCILMKKAKHPSGTLEKYDGKIMGLTNKFFYSVSDLTSLK